jgi:2-polyprenyl-3-methyl-5-hydroxy-6-metoxy-1,4-benzoquinol methylase
VGRSAAADRRVSERLAGARTSDLSGRRAHVPREAAAILDARSLSASHRHLARLLRPGQRVLDVGCGTGAITRGIADAVAPAGRAVGIDVSEELLGRACQVHRGVRGLAFSQADAAREQTLCLLAVQGRRSGRTV